LLRDVWDPKRCARGARWRSCLVAVACSGAVVLAFESRSSAQTTLAPFYYVSLRYAAEGSAERCWDEVEFRRNVARAVGYDPFRADAAVTVRVHVGGSTALVDGGVEWRNANGASMGERRFLAKDGNCTKLLTEMSFAVGLQIQFLRSPAPATPSSAASPSGTSPSATSASATPPSAPAPPPKTPQRQAAQDDAALEPAVPTTTVPWRMWVGAGPSLAWGVSPSLTGEGGFFFGVRRSDWSLELGAAGTLPVTEREPDGSGFRQNLIGGSTSLCGHRRALAACLLGQASQLRVSGLGVDKPRSPRALVVQAGLRLRAAWEISGPWSMTPHLDTLGLLTPRAVALNRVDVWEMPRLSVVVGIDVAARFR